jgi:hypothetical protein
LCTLKRLSELIRQGFPGIVAPELICLLVLLVAGQGVASGFALCVGEDGHSAFEQARAGSCVPAEPSFPAEDNCSCSFSTHDHCGSCQDFSTPSDSLHGRSRGDQDLSTPLPLSFVSAVSVPQFTLFIRDLTANLSPLPPPRPYIELIALRTVVLLI